MDQNKMQGAISMAEFGGMEFSTFRLKAGATEEALSLAGAQAVEGLMADLPGFLGHSLLKAEDGRFVDVVFAKSRQMAIDICAQWVGHPACSAYLALIEEGSVEFGFFERVR